MWIAKNINKNHKKNTSGMTGFIKSGAEKRIAASAENGTAKYRIAAPSGFLSVPFKEEDAVVLSTPSGQICIGVSSYQEHFYPQPGEVIIYSNSGAQIWLKNNNTIEISGNIKINGNIDLTGNIHISEEET